ncbi:uncharacterized protein [Euphorbia lathyris]|uniref:uncharacterized protein n=1 Tax=Euphorbia lathyris TaxID=212925 RepID=UPI003313EFF3
MAKNHASSPFLFSSTLLSFPSAPSESTPPSSPPSPSPSPSPSSSRSNSSFNSPYDYLSSGSRPPLSHSSSSHFPPAVCGPCAACKFHGRRWSEKCYLASFFPPNDVHKFAVVGSVFGSGNVDKFLQQNSNSSYIPLLLLLRDTTRVDWELLSDSKNNTLSETDLHKQLGAPMDSDHIRELIQGRELAKQLKKHLSSESSDTLTEQLVERILSSFEKSLSIPNSIGLTTQLQNDVALAAPASNDPTKSPIYMDASPATVNIDAIPKDSAKRRKASAIWKKHVRVSSEYEGPNDDGYSWRNYGQNDIRGAKYPRSMSIKEKCTCFLSWNGQWNTLRNVMTYVGGKSKLMVLSIEIDLQKLKERVYTAMRVDSTSYDLQMSMQATYGPNKVRGRVAPIDDDDDVMGFIEYCRMNPTDLIPLYVTLSLRTIDAEVLRCHEDEHVDPSEPPEVSYDPTIEIETRMHVNDDNDSGNDDDDDYQNYDNNVHYDEHFDHNYSYENGDNVENEVDVSHNQNPRKGVHETSK